MSIYEAEELSERIINNEHYRKCFYESEYFNSFKEKILICKEFIFVMMIYIVMN